MTNKERKIEEKKNKEHISAANKVKTEYQKGGKYQFT